MECEDGDSSDSDDDEVDKAFVAIPNSFKAILAYVPNSIPGTVIGSDFRCPNCYFLNSIP